MKNSTGFGSMFGSILASMFDQKSSPVVFWPIWGCIVGSIVAFLGLGRSTKGECVKTKKINKHDVEARRAFSRIEGVQHLANADPKHNFGHAVAETHFLITCWKHVLAHCESQIDQRLQHKRS